MSDVRMFEFWGGVPEFVIHANEKAAVREASRYEPDLNPTYQELASPLRNHGAAGAPPPTPRDKAKVEAARSSTSGAGSLAPLRNQTFFSPGELREAIAPLLLALNERPFKKIEGSRRSWFEDLDLPALKPLPTERYSKTSTSRPPADWTAPYPAPRLGAVDPGRPDRARERRNRIRKVLPGVRARPPGLPPRHLDMLLSRLPPARRTGSNPKVIQRLARAWLLILDDWGLASLSGQGRPDLLGGPRRPLRPPRHATGQPSPRRPLARGRR